MEIKDLEANTKLINLVATITHLDETSQTPTGKRVQEGILSDNTGQVKISLWEEYVDQFKEGDKIIIISGWCKAFPRDSADLQVSAGKFGKIQKVPPEKP